MKDLLLALAKLAGTSTIGAAIVFFLWKNVLQPIYTRYLDYKLEKAKLHEKTLVDVQDKNFSKRLEVETIKLNRVLPSLEEINLEICNHILMFNTYLVLCERKGNLRSDMENERLEIDKKIIGHIYKISIYLPTEIRVMLTQIRKIISCSWTNPQTIYQIVSNSVFNPKEVYDKAEELYSKHHDCLYDMVLNYCNIGDEKEDFHEILNKYGFDADGKLKTPDLLTKFVKIYLLFPEYISKNDSNDVMENAFRD